MYGMDGHGSAYVACEGCGTVVLRGTAHTCNERQRLEHQVRCAHPERLEQEIADWLPSPHARFLVYVAERDRLQHKH